MLRPSTWLSIYVWLIDQSIVLLEGAASIARRWGL